MSSAPSPSSLCQRFGRLRSTAEWTDFTHRLQHCLLILGCIFYLRLSLLFFRGFRCVVAADPLLSSASDAVATRSLYLAEDLQTRCWTGGHLQTMAAVLLLLALYTFGLPAACFVLLMRNFADAHTKGALGWLWARVAILHGPHCAVACTEASGGGSEKRTAVAAAWVAPVASLSPTAQAGSVADCSTADVGPIASPSAGPRARAQVIADLPPTSAAKYGSVDAVDSSCDPASAEQATSSQLVASRTARFGYLFHTLRESSFAFGLSTFALHAWVALVTVFVSDSDPLLKLFLFGLAWTALTLATAAELPYEALSDNARKVAIGVATLAHSTLLLAVQTGGRRSAFFFLLLALLVLLVLSLLFRRQIPLWLADCLGCASPWRVQPTSTGGSGGGQAQPQPAEESDTVDTADPAPAAAAISVATDGAAPPLAAPVVSTPDSSAQCDEKPTEMPGSASSSSRGGRVAAVHFVPPAARPRSGSVSLSRPRSQHSRSGLQRRPSGRAAAGSVPVTVVAVTESDRGGALPGAVPEMDGPTAPACLPASAFPSPSPPLPASESHSSHEAAAAAATLSSGVWSGSADAVAASLSSVPRLLPLQLRPSALQLAPLHASAIGRTLARAPCTVRMQPLPPTAKQNNAGV
jgi:hypothetical protein